MIAFWFTSGTVSKASYSYIPYVSFNETQMKNIYSLRELYLVIRKELVSIINQNESSWNIDTVHGLL